MKKFLILHIALCLTAAHAIGQCNNAFYSLDEGHEFEMTTYNDKDKPQVRMINKVGNVSEKNDSYEATFHSKIFDKKDELISDGEYVVICEDGNLKIDMERLTSSMSQLSAYDDMEAEGEVSFLVIPSSLEVGQSLPDGQTKIKASMGGSSLTTTTMNIDIINRKVEAKENLTTPAGTFECYKITYDTNINTEMMGFSNKITFSNAEWIARGVGVVKTESYDKKGRLKSYSLLTDLNK